MQRLRSVLPGRRDTMRIDLIDFSGGRSWMIGIGDAKLAPPIVSVPELESPRRSLPSGIRPSEGSF